MVCMCVCKCMDRLLERRSARPPSKWWILEGAAARLRRVGPNFSGVGEVLQLLQLSI